MTTEMKREVQTPKTQNPSDLSSLRFETYPIQK